VPSLFRQIARFGGPSRRQTLVALAAIAITGVTLRAAVAAPASETVVDLGAFQRMPSQSGPVNYYKLVGTGADAFIHAEYEPPWNTTVLGYPIPEAKRRSVASLRWKWRAITLPRGGDECADGKQDSAAVVYVTWRKTFKWYSLKYVFSAVGAKGKTCDRKSNPFRSQETIIVDSGPPTGEWRVVSIDPDVEFRRHFAPDDPHAEVPDLIGMAIMTDGDQTKSKSSADYAGFTISWK
jgi:hypothetical protein